VIAVYLRGSALAPGPKESKPLHPRCISCRRRRKPFMIQANDTTVCKPCYTREVW
jgi:hypothetical protein